MGIFRTSADYRQAQMKAFRQPGIVPGEGRLDRFLDEITAEYQALAPKVKAAREKVEKAREMVVSRDEVMRVMGRVVRDWSARDYAPIFKERVESIWQNPAFDENFTFECDPLLDPRAQGLGPALADAIYFLMPDLLLGGIEARVSEIVPKSAKGTLADKRKAIATAEAEFNELDAKASALLSEYRTLLDDRYAMPGDHRKPSAPAPILDNTLPEVADDSPAKSSQPSSYLASMDAARQK